MKPASESLTCLVAVVAFVLLSHMHIHSELSIHRFKKIAADGVVFTEAAEDFNSGTRSRCAATCSLRPQCLSYSYHSSTGRCLVFHRRVFYGTRMAASAARFQHYWKMTDHCPTDNGFSVQAGRCVDVRDTRITWNDSQQECETHGGHLYVGRTAEDMEAVKIAIQNLGNPSLDYRVGALDHYANGSWMWITGVTVTDNLWKDGVVGSSDSTKTCCETALSEADKLIADGCHKVDRYICQVSLGFPAP